MKLTENYIKEDSPTKKYDFGKNQCQLKYNYASKNIGEVKTYKWSKEEIEVHLKEIKK